MIAWPLAELLPHAGDMILIDQVLAFDEEQIQTRLRVRAGGLFNREDGSLPAWVGIELMAQSVAAYAGCRAHLQGRPVELGFLLGTRKFECNVEHFPLDVELHIHALRSLEDDNGMGVFECHLTGPGIHASARLNVFRPPQAENYLAQHPRRPAMTESILVTGSSRGIGRAIALRLARAGFDLVLHCRSGRSEADAVMAEVQALGRSARVLQFDVSERAQCKAILEADVEAHGAYYGVVLNAGLTRDGAFPALSEDDWDVVMRTNLDGFYNVLHPVMMPMIRRRQAGRIVCITSVSGLIGNRGQVNYSASKAGLIGAAKALAIELGKRKITVNCVAPGLIDTAMLDENVPVEELMKMIPAQRMGTPEEVAGAVNFLMSAEAGYITRQVLAVNGGLC